MTHDLTQTLGSFMDRHLLVPLLNFLATKGLYDKRELDEAKMQLIFGTNMVDEAMDIYKELHKTQKVPEEYTKRREEVRASNWLPPAARRRPCGRTQADLLWSHRGHRGCVGDARTNTAQVLGVMGELQAEVAPILELVQDQGRVNELRQEKLFTQAYLQQLGITPAHVEVLHR